MKWICIWKCGIEPEPIANICNILDEYLLLNEVVVSTDRRIARSWLKYVLNVCLYVCRTLSVGMASAWPCLWLSVRVRIARKKGRPGSQSLWWGRRQAELHRSPCHNMAVMSVCIHSVGKTRPVQDGDPLASLLNGLRSQGV